MKKENFILKTKILKKKAIVGLIGLGYVGLELATLISKKKFNVLGFDKSLDKINLIKKNISPIASVDNKKISFLKKENLYTLSDIDKIKICDIIIIALPTPLTKNELPDMSYLKSCMNDILPFLRKEQMLILESTVYPGATIDIFGNIIKKKFKLGFNFNLCFSPERISPGKKLSYGYKDIPKIVSGYSKNCLNNVGLFYSKIFKTIFFTKSIEIAEFTKLYENAFRAVNIGFVNQMKIITDKLGLDISEIINAASTKPFGFTPFSPGPGVGGHCIPIDPLFISYAAKKKKVSSEFINLARNVNLRTTKWTINKIKNNLKKNSNLLILGVAYKKNIDDERESPAIEIIQQLKSYYKISYYDPYIPLLKVGNIEYSSLSNFKYSNLKKFTCCVIVADHDCFDYKKIIKYSKKIFDTRRVLHSYKSSKVIYL